MWLFTVQSCVCLDGTPQKLFPMFLVRKSDVHWHRYLLCTLTQRRPCSCWTTSGLSFSSTWTKALHFPTTNRCASCFAWIFVVPSHDLSCPLVRPQYMYSCSNWGLCFSGFLHWLHASQKSVLAYDKYGRLAAAILRRVQPREPDPFHAKFLEPWTENSAVVWAFPAEVGVSSSRMLLRCLFNLPFCHRWSWKLCPLLKTVLAVITPRRTKVFLGWFCSGITRLTICHACPRPESVFASASVAGHWRRVPACAHTCKEKRKESMITSRSQKTCPDIQLSELPLGPEMKRLSKALGRSFLFWSASALCTEKFEGFF